MHKHIPKQKIYRWEPQIDQFLAFSSKKKNAFQKEIDLKANDTFFSFWLKQHPNSKSQFLCPLSIATNNAA